MTVFGKTGFAAAAALMMIGHAQASAIGTPKSCSDKISTLQAERSHYRQRFVPVAKDVTLEVLDWGGRGRPLILLAGLGNTAHVFDDIAPTLTKDFHGGFKFRSEHLHRAPPLDWPSRPAGL
jgi:hypothetical protein